MICFGLPVPLFRSVEVMRRKSISTGSSTIGSGCTQTTGSSSSSLDDTVSVSGFGTDFEAMLGWWMSELLASSLSDDSSSSFSVSSEAMASKSSGSSVRRDSGICLITRIPFVGVGVTSCESDSAATTTSV
ncbi:hypothetical protein BCR33DRAFT_414033 [Rhizoclosmatium globosum]|uniref:Uncharacterized protein n=1 Tax=Rhizoclosmatium globosum TaxID=329046 RepID=A0A1Y2BXN0_9FUNG|nr:hypothetical protein BCR33DRAFT_414033 [Rhizoclosmatium globosum]|eukprot:ORY39424.1 hypothetical protein BCR33DRAFT_414033 [Rhizoclosmatium globosum]